MKRRPRAAVYFMVMMAVLFLFGACDIIASDKVPVIREAEEKRDSSVAVEAYLIGDILEVKVSVRMPNARPKIDNVIVVGPRIGRISPDTIEQIYAGLEEEASYRTTKRSGFISFEDRTTTKKLKGTVVRKSYRFKMDREKIISDGLYQLWIKIKEEGLSKKGRITPYKFDLVKLPELLNSSITP